MPPPLQLHAVQTGLSSQKMSAARTWSVKAKRNIRRASIVRRSALVKAKRVGGEEGARGIQDFFGGWGSSYMPPRALHKVSYTSRVTRN